MAHVVFLRGVNVGGHRTFRPAVLAQRMKRFDVVNVGAAGTFVVRARVGPAELRSELCRRLPFVRTVGHLGTLDRVFQTPVTTRSWSTIGAIRGVLERASLRVSS
jgi:uncharacterized protein (DUF1697 family)